MTRSLLGKVGERIQTRTKTGDPPAISKHPTTPASSANTMETPLSSPSMLIANVKANQTKTTPLKLQIFERWLETQPTVALV